MKMEPQKTTIPKIQAEISDMLRQFNESYKEALAPLQNAISEMTKSLIRIPKLEFPHIDWEDFNEKFTKDCESNAKFGWCLSAQMHIGTYRRFARMEDSQRVRDSLFLELFEDNEMELYREEKEYIIAYSSSEWKEFYQDCFKAFELGMYKLVIPALLSAIEHELHLISENGDYGRKLIRTVKSKILNSSNPDDFSFIVGASVISLLQNGIFESISFEQMRPVIINRNWVLHGRDNPSEWNRVDVYKLISIISAIKMLSN